MGEQLQYMVEGKIEPKGYEQIPTLTLVQPLKVPTGARVALLQAVGQNIRWLDNGFNPTAVLGMQLVPGEDKVYTGDLARLRFIEEAASAELNVTYQGIVPSVDVHIAPDSIANLASWWDADDGATITEATGVSAFTDKAGNLDFAEGTGSLQPILTPTAGLGGRNAIVYDGVDDILATTNTFDVDIAEETIFLVCKMPTQAASQGFLESSNQDEWAILKDGGNAFEFYGGSFNEGEGSIEDIAYDNSAFHIFVIRRKVAADPDGVMAVWIDGGPSAKTVLHSVTGTGNLTLKLGVGSGNSSLLEFAEGCRYLRFLTFAEIDSLCLNYFVPKWGAGAGEPSWTKMSA